MLSSSPRFAPGDLVRVRNDYPPGHVRTPVYIRGKIGIVTKLYGIFPNPEQLAHSLPSDPLPLYQVRFRQGRVWDSYAGGALDTITIDVYENWLEQVAHLELGDDASLVSMPRDPAE